MTDLAMPAEISRLLQDSIFPISTGDLINHARQNGASPAMLKRLRALPAHVFNCPADIHLTMGLIGEFQAAEHKASPPAKAGNVAPAPAAKTAADSARAA